VPGRIWEFYLREPTLTLLIVGNLVFAAAALLLALSAVLLRLSNDRKARRWGALEARWEPTCLDVVVGLEPPERAWALVAPGDRMFFLNFLLRFAKRVSGPERRIVDDLAEPYLDLVVRQLRYRAPERRARAVQTLSRLGRRRYAARLLQALDDPSPLVAMVAARALARRESPDFAGAILQRLHRFDQWRPSFIASMLAAMGPAVAPTLRLALTDEHFTSRARGVAADALRELHDYEAADGAAAMLRRTKERDLIAATLNLLAHVGRAEHLPAIRNHVDAPDPIVRARAIAALGMIGAPEDVPRIVEAFYDPSPWVALRAAEALRDTHATAALTALARPGAPRAELARSQLEAIPES
jgi:HEAT repeat protein